LAEGRAFDESMLEPPAVAEAARALLTTANHDVRLAVVIESVAGFVGTEAEAPLVEVLRRLRPLGGLVIAEEQFAGWGGVSSLLLDLKSARRGLLLRPEATEAEMLLRVALPRAARMPLPPGRGVLVEQGHSVTVQLPHMASVG